MRASRKLNRRSFVASVVGGAVLGGGATALVTGEARAQSYSGVTDCDSGNNHDRPGFGTGVRNQYTDSDTGPNADPRCHGRGSNTGSDSGTSYNQAEHPNTGCSDRDYGQYGDPGGHGRSCRGMQPNQYAPRTSGCTDNDPASSGDSAGNGRHCSPR